MHLTHAALTTVAVASEAADALWNKGLVLFIRKQFAWEFIGQHGIWGYWQNSLTRERTAKRVSTMGTGRLHRSWLTGSDWDHERYPLGATGFEEYDAPSIVREA